MVSEFPAVIEFHDRIDGDATYHLVKVNTNGVSAAYLRTPESSTAYVEEWSTRLAYLNNFANGPDRWIECLQQGQQVPAGL